MALEFKGIPVTTQAEVSNVVISEMKTLMGGIDQQIKMLAEVLVLHLAEHNKLSYEFCNIEGVTDKNSADRKIIEFRDTIWAYRNQLDAEAKQFIKDNNLK